MGKNVLGRFQTREFSYWKGLTRDNHLGAIFAKMPQKATDVMVQLLAYNRGKTLESLIGSLPTKEFDNEEEYTWDVIGSNRRNITLIEARDENGKIIEADDNYMVGSGTAPFYLVFGEDWFADGRCAA